MNGAGRDSVDTRIINEAANGTGKIINAVAEVSSKDTAYAVGVADTDRDGMVDWFEDLYGFNKLVADNNGDGDRDGFTNVEEYINGLITGFDLGKAKIGKTLEGAGGVALTAAGSGANDVTGFASGKGKIDVSAVLSGYTGQALSKVVEIGYAKGDSYVSVGTGTTKTLVAVVDSALVKLTDITASVSTAAAAATAPTSEPAIAPAAVVTPAVEVAPAVVVTPAAPVVPAAPAAPVAAAVPVAPAVPAAAAVSTYKHLTGMAGNDSFAIKSDLERVSEAVNGGTDTVTSYVPSYTLDANVENLSLKGTLAFAGLGNELANKITGNANANTIEGAAGDDKLYGVEGDDRLLGGLGADWLQGDAGNDVIRGGKGADTLIGGLDCDAFCFEAGDSNASAMAAEDKITDFGLGDVIYVGSELVDMTQVAAATIKTAKYADAFAAASKLVGASNDMALVHGTKDAWLFWDANHDGKIDSGVTLVGAELNVAAWLVSPGADAPLI